MPSRLRLRIHDEISEREIDLTLDDWFDAVREATTTVADYRNRRIHRTDGETRTEEALLATLSFRHFECSNRIHVGQVVEAGKPTDWHPYHADLSRHELAQGGVEHLDELAWQGEIATCRGHEVFGSEGPLVPSDPALRHRLARYLRRTVGGHSAIYDRVLRHRVPRRLRFTFHQEPREVTVEVLQQLEPGLRPDLDQPLRPIAEDVLQSCMDEAGSLGPFTDADEEAAMAGLRAHVDAERWLPALLSIFEWGWCRNPLPAQMQNVVPKLVGITAQNQRLADILNGTAGLPTEARVSEVLALRSDAHDKSHCLDVFAGSLLMREDSSRAEEHLLAALGVRPRLAGPYHDLGMLHARQYEFTKAYRCWEFVRWIAPRHPIMSDVDAREADVLQAERAVPFGSMALD